MCRSVTFLLLLFSYFSLFSYLDLIRNIADDIHKNIATNKPISEMVLAFLDNDLDVCCFHNMFSLPPALSIH